MPLPNQKAFYYPSNTASSFASKPTLTLFEHHGLPSASTCLLDSLLFYLLLLSFRDAAQRLKVPGSAWFCMRVPNTRSFGSKCGVCSLCPHDSRIYHPCQCLESIIPAIGALGGPWFASCEATCHFRHFKCGRVPAAPSPYSKVLLTSSVYIELVFKSAPPLHPTPKPIFTSESRYLGNIG